MEEKLYIIKKGRGYIGHPCWRVTNSIQSAVVFADTTIAKEVAQRQKGKLFELKIGREVLVPNK